MATRDRLTPLIRINKHLGRALGVMSANSGLWIGDIREYKELVRIKLKLENFIEYSTKQENREKKRFLDKLK